MPNVLDADGLLTATREELVTYVEDQFRLIYGADINLDSDTPDGQLIGIFVQMIIDLQDLLVTIYNGFDPDNARGKVLDQRVAINGIQRQAGTHTVTPITIVNTQSVNLYGLDGAEPGSTRDDGNEVYTVSDNEGNRWQLEETQLGVAAGTHSYDFQALLPGAQLTTPNTITVPITVVLGVSSVNNPTTYTTLGLNEESDAALKIRRQRSVSLASQGYLEGLLAALLNVDGVTSAFVYENSTDSTDSDGVPSHSIWVIVAGTGAPADIAEAIYTKRNAGCGMFGDETYIITQVDGSPFVVRWDDVDVRNLFIFFTATPIDGVTPPDLEAIREGLPESFIPGVYSEVNINGLATLVQELDPNCLVTQAGFTDGEEQIAVLSGVPASGVFKVSYAGNESAAINWDDAIGTIQTKVQGIAGLENCLVTGSLATQSLTFDLSDVGGVQSLITFVDNTLLTGGAAAIVFVEDYDLQNTLLPLSKQYQFVVSAENIVITAMQLSPSSAIVDTLESTTFQALGGYGAYVYSISVNNSGGSIDAETGEYTAGATPAVTDTVKAEDALGNSITALVTVQ